MNRTTITGPPAARFSGPPPERMAGRPSRAGAVAKASARPMTGQTAAQVLDEAIAQGVITTGLRDHYATCYAADPTATVNYLEALGLRPPERSQGTQADAEEYPQAGLSRGERERIAAARAGHQPRMISGGL